MLFKIIGGLTGAYLAGKLFYPAPFINYVLDKSVWEAILIIGVNLLVIGCIAFLGYLLGEFISSLVGNFLPQKHEDHTYRIGALREERHWNGKFYYTTYEYTYYHDGMYKPASVSTSQARIVSIDQFHVTLRIRRYFFPQQWWRYLASEKYNEYIFYVPHGGTKL